MAFATAGDEVSNTASGRLMTMEAMNPSMMVFMVAAVCQAMLPAMAMQSRQIALGAGSRNSRMPKSRTAASQRMTSPATAISGMAASRKARAPQAGLRGAAFAGTASEDELTDAMRAALEFRRALEIEGARPRERHVDDFGDAPGPRRHHHDAVGEQHRLGNGMRDEDD